MPKKIQYLVLFAILLLPALLSAVQPHYSQAKLIGVERKTREKVNMYLVNTPVSTEVPYYQITVRLDQNDYKAEYTPRHPEEQLPETWVEGADVMVRVETSFVPETSGRLGTAVDPAQAEPRKELT